MDSYDREELEYEKDRLRQLDGIPKWVKWLSFIFTVLLIAGLINCFFSANPLFGAEFEVIQSTTIDKIDLPASFHVEESTTSECTRGCEDVALESIE